ncbi:hypothetical protein [Parvularcula lutaonensis]|uniref:Haem-binding uptake Tiki superfamily ChaN domain-containing protein n=1 Tax=Parvularcula lutaonensis TaxID=491923 RepID=A0ABV7ME36_9PROT|nr:hypothetical protein [Parvularcula lutaonensis]GGY54387.1 hypothetical protein GCM10007148_24970 [Parvularcula lutaonensis]
MFRAALATIALSACVSAPNLAQQTGCRPPAGWEAAALRAEGQILTFGETHGTKEGPAAVAEYVCAASAKGGGKTVFAVEIGKRYDAALQAALQADDPRKALVDAMPGF